MAKLIKETVEDVNVEILQESADQPKSYYLHGRYMQAESINKNGRKYPKHILENELHRYQPYITNKKAQSLGELGHPDSPTINLPLASHRIAELKFEGNDVIGRAKVLDTPNGQIVKKFIDEGIILGMSTRGMGSVKTITNYDQVQEDFRLSTVDIVADPSGLDCFVNGILENVEWIMHNGVWTKLSETQQKNERQIISEASREQIEGIAINIFSGFLKNIVL